MRGYSLAETEQLVNEAIQFDPHFTLSYIFLAETHWSNGKKHEAREALLKVLSIPGNATRDFAAENRRAKETARRLLKKREVDGETVPEG